MAYNSDGYIMIDFTEVDFRRTNQTIDGLYKRCVDVIGTNKFILVINANGRTPLPATCSFTNNQYVIDTCIYMFAISSNDNLFIRRNDVPASDIIDDSSVSVDKTWSSNKIDNELDGKADASALANYQPLLTAVSPISIDVNDNISVDLSGKQDVLTPVSPVSINASNEISVDLNGVTVKSFTYKGTGTTTNTIEFETTPKVVLGVVGTYINNVGWYRLAPIFWGVSQWVDVHTMFGSVQPGSGVGEFAQKIDFSDNNLIITSNNSDGAMNIINNTYTVYYI